MHFSYKVQFVITKCYSAAFLYADHPKHLTVFKLLTIYIIMEIVDILQKT